MQNLDRKIGQWCESCALTTCICANMSQFCGLVGFRNVTEMQGGSLQCNTPIYLERMIVINQDWYWYTVVGLRNRMVEMSLQCIPEACRELESVQVLSNLS